MGFLLSRSILTSECWIVISFVSDINKVSGVTHPLQQKEISPNEVSAECGRTDTVQTDRGMMSSPNGK